MVTHTLLYAWAIPAAIALVVVAFVIGWRSRPPRPAQRKVTWVSNASYLTDLPAFRARMSLYRTGLMIVAGLLGLAAVAAGVMGAKPVDKQIRSDELASRDIVLCLDVSGSMIEYDTQIVEKFLELVPSFHGERVALSIWNTTSRTVFPLTDDYDLVTDELKQAAYALSFDVHSLSGTGVGWDQAKYDAFMDLTGGTQPRNPSSASLVGDGLASCTLMFDQADTERSRSILFATDNDVQGTPIYTLPEAADLLTEKKITLFSIYAGAEDVRAPALRKEYEEVTTSHGGSFFEASDPGLSQRVVEQIAQQQAVDLESDPQVLMTDRLQPYYPWLVALLAIYLVAVWRLRS